MSAERLITIMADLGMISRATDPRDQSLPHRRRSGTSPAASRTPSWRGSHTRGSGRPTGVRMPARASSRANTGSAVLLSSIALTVEMKKLTAPDAASHGGPRSGVVGERSGQHQVPPRSGAPGPQVAFNNLAAGVEWTEWWHNRSGSTGGLLCGEPPRKVTAAWVDANGSELLAVRDGAAPKLSSARPD